VYTFKLRSTRLPENRSHHAEGERLIKVLAAPAPFSAMGSGFCPAVGCQFRHDGKTSKFHINSTQFGAHTWIKLISSIRRRFQYPSKDPYLAVPLG
jgi:hypothetical protein